jgi:hypothetical protein
MANFLSVVKAAKQISVWAYYTIPPALLQEIPGFLRVFSVFPGLFSEMLL